MKAYPFIIGGKVHEAYGYLPFNDFPEDLYNYFCKDKLPIYDERISHTHSTVVLLFRRGFSGITRWNLSLGDSTQGLPLLTLDQLKELAFIDSLEN